MANKKTREREINAAKVKVYENKKKSLKIMSPIAIAIIAASVLLMFVPFIEIMNDPSRAGQTGAAFVEQEGANGCHPLLRQLHAAPGRRHGGGGVVDRQGGAGA